MGSNDNDNTDAMEDRAYNCGRDNTDGAWIDDMVAGDHKDLATAAYHEGLAERYEEEDW